MYNTIPNNGQFYTVQPQPLAAGYVPQQYSNMGYPGQMQQPQPQMILQPQPQMMAPPNMQAAAVSSPPLQPKVIAATKDDNMDMILTAILKYVDEKKQRLVLERDRNWKIEIKEEQMNRTTIFTIKRHGASSEMPSSTIVHKQIEDSGCSQYTISDFITKCINAEVQIFQALAAAPYQPAIVVLSDAISIIGYACNGEVCYAYEISPTVYVGFKRDYSC